MMFLEQGLAPSGCYQCFGRFDYYTGPPKSLGLRKETKIYPLFATFVVLAPLLPHYHPARYSM